MKMEPLNHSIIHRNLESRPKLLGFEMQDLVGLAMFFFNHELDLRKNAGLESI